MNIDPASVQWSRPPGGGSGRLVLLTLHGHGMSESMGLDLRSQFSEQVAVASLRGPIRSGAGFGWFPLDDTLTVTQVEDSASAVLRWLDAQQLSGPVGILGFSQGACTAFQALRQAPDRFRFAVNLSGFVSPLPHAGDARLAEQRPPTFYARGLTDHLVPDFLVQSTAEWMRRHTTVTEKTYAGLGHNVNAAEIRDLRTFVDQFTPPSTA